MTFKLVSRTGTIKKKIFFFFLENLRNNGEIIFNCLSKAKKPE